MQGSFRKRFLIGTTAAVWALAWAVVPLSQAQTEATQEECDATPAPAVAASQTPPPATQSAGLQKTKTDAPVDQAQPGDEAQNFRNDRSKNTAPVRNDKQVAVRKPRREMDDREMDATCGGITGGFDMTQSGNMTLNDNSAQSISLSDQAQQNLNSMVNITSINSTISVMLNLNVNINSTVGTINQGNSGLQNSGVQNTTVGAP